MDHIVGAILHYCCRRKCIVYPHSNRTLQCHKGCGWWCNQCCKLSLHLTYVYTTHFTSLCIVHLLSSCNPTIHYWKSSQIVLYSPITGTKNHIILERDTINESADSISIGKNIYIIGGSGPIDLVYKFNIKAKALIKKSSMLVKKCFHSLCSANQLIFSIGGFDETNYLADCEVYSTKDNKWSKLSNLIVARGKSAVAVINLIHVYTIGGRSDIQENINSIEKLKLKKFENWSMVSMQNMIPPRRIMHSIQIGYNKVLVFGGYDGVMVYGDSYLMDVDECVCVNGNKMKSCDSFMCVAAPVTDGQRVYAMSENRRIHIYCILTGEWSEVHD